MFTKRNPRKRFVGWFAAARGAIKNGDILTKASFFVFGLGSLIRGQVAKGFIFLGIEAVYIYYMFTSGAFYLKNLPTLGTVVQGKYFDEAAGIYRYTEGDNSMLILLFGVLTLFVTLFALIMAIKSMESAYKAQESRERGVKPQTIKQDIKSLFDGSFHKTLLSPPALGLIAFTVLPLIFMILMAFTNFDRYHQPPGNLFTWVGLDNFKNIFWSNPVWSRTFVNILIWTLIWAVCATFTNYILGMLLALLINKKNVRLKKLWRTIFIMTIAVPQFVSLNVMRLLLNDEGTINVLLTSMGLISSKIQFLTNGNLARITVIIVNIWVGIPYTMLITSGILMNIPEELYESARIDGAGPIKTFTKITLPYMLFVTAPYLITQFIANINNFNVIYLLTRGEPRNLAYYQGGETDLLVTWLYRLTVDFQDYNLASTIGIIVFVICAVISLIFYNRTRSVKEEDDFA